MSEFNASQIKQYDDWIAYHLAVIDGLKEQRDRISDKPAEQRLTFETSIDAAIRSEHQAIDELKKVKAAYT